MKLKKTFAALMAVVIAFSSVLNFSVLADDAQRMLAENDADKSMRVVGIHAQKKNIMPSNPTTLYRGEPANIYMAVDKPNKGDYSVDSNNNITRLEPQYDLNGYSVKFYLEKEYFEIIEGDTPGKPLNYKLPAMYDDDTETENGETVPSVGAGYFPFAHGTTETEIDGRKYYVVYATILFNGMWLPDKDVDWYNLCAIPVRTIKNGTTEVYVEVGTSDEYALELYSKDTPDESRKNFDIRTVNGGRHTIIIENQPKPAAPVATPKSGTYPERQLISLSAQEDCDIYYSLNGGAIQKYTNPFEITVNTTLVCYAKSTLGEARESDKVTYKYIISAQRPYLYNSDKTALIPEIYDTETNEYKVYFSDTADGFRDIPDGTEIYYTFRQDIEPVIPDVAVSDPHDGWVKVSKRFPELTVTDSCNVRMFTDKSGICSEVVTYELGFSPSEVTAVDFETGVACGSGEYDEPIEVKLVTDTPNAEIYYTLDGTSPLNEVYRYDSDVPIVISGNKILRAVAKVDGKYSPVMTNWYVVKDVINDYGVIAFYPSGKYEGEITVTLIPENPEYSVEYRYEGETDWTVYDKGKQLLINDDAVIIARAVDNAGNTNGDEFKFTYKIYPKPPVFSTESTQFTNNDKVTVYCSETMGQNTDKYELYYTLDGTWPITRPTDGSAPQLVDGVLQADAAEDSVDVRIDKYTVITAVVVKDGKYFSTVVQNSYDVVKDKLTMPAPTLTPGYYNISLDMSADCYTTTFLQMPDNIEIYYTVSDKGEEFCPDPVAFTTENGTQYYDKNNPQPIQLKGNTVIKAVAVNGYGGKSDIGIFEYVITHDAPSAAPGGTLHGTVLPVVPVSAVAGSKVTYKVGDFGNIIENAPGKFYIDTATGNAYINPDDPATLLGEASGRTFSASAMLEISSELYGIKSDTNYYRYSVSTAPDVEVLAQPYADKVSGSYMEQVVDNEGTMLVVRLDSLNYGVTIQYRINNGTEWKNYNDDNPIKIKDGDTVLQARCVRVTDGVMEVSRVSSYSYAFYPIPPVITLESGWYPITESTYETTTIKLDSSSVPTDLAADYETYYTIKYADGSEDVESVFKGDSSASVAIKKDMKIIAYVKNPATGRESNRVVRNYFVSSNSATVKIEAPYDDVKRIESHRVYEKPWSDGIRLSADNASSNVDIYYQYVRTNTDGTVQRTNTRVYDPDSPIIVTSNTAAIEIEAWLVDENGEVSGSRKTFEKIHFYTCEPPETSLEGKDTVRFDKDTGYTIIDNELYQNDPKFTMYYTTDGSDPVIYDPVTGEAILNGTKFERGGTPLKLSSDTTVKTVYRSACGDLCDECRAGDYDNCHYPIYGQISTYYYFVKGDDSGGGNGGNNGGNNGNGSGGGSSSGGGGGGRGNSGVGGIHATTQSSKYTIDIFGNEHPTHIGYINGYPDGSVRPDGNLTREEVTAILYRIKNKAYDEPFSITGKVFPDVNYNRWSVLEIEYMANDKVVEGYPNGEFKPSQNLTRAEFAALIRRFTNSSHVENTEKEFADVDSTHWAYKDIISIAERGLIKGYEDGTYRPEKKITRAEAMTVINKLLGRKPSENYVKSLGFNPFNDLLKDKWYYVIVLEATITHNYYLDIGSVEMKWEDYK